MSAQGKKQFWLIVTRTESESVQAFINAVAQSFQQADYFQTFDAAGYLFVKNR